MISRAAPLAVVLALVLLGSCASRPRSRWSITSTPTGACDRVPEGTRFQPRLVALQGSSGDGAAREGLYTVGDERRFGLATGEVSGIDLRWAVSTPDEIRIGYVYITRCGDPDRPSRITSVVLPAGSQPVVALRCATEVMCEGAP